MTISEVLLQDYDVEISNTRRTLERIPDAGEGKTGFAPHSKSMKLGKLAMHCAMLPLFGLYIIEDDGMDLAKPQHSFADLTFSTRANCLERLEECAARCRAAIAAASDESMTAPWRFSYGEQLISNNPRSLTFRLLCLNHLVHHTAQLGVYLRLNDIPVPALYGPSADER